MKKKLISLILVMAMILLPLSGLLNVSATTQNTNGIQYDDSRTKTGDSASYFVTGTADIIVYDINANATENDEFSAYKVVDVFYNPTTNQFSYQFTTTFAIFVGTLTTAEIQAITGDNSATTFTVDDYLDSTKVTSDAVNEHMYNTTSTLNLLVSKYATYIRNNSITGTSMIYGDFDSDGDDDDAKVDDVSAGAYLVLADSTITLEIYNGFNFKVNNVYGVMVANLMYGVNNGVWELDDCTIYSKHSASFTGMVLAPISVTDVMNLNSGNLTISQEQMARYKSAAGAFTSVNSGGKIYLAVADSDINIPVNIHSSINQNIINLIKYTQVSLPNGFSFDYSDIVTGNFLPVTKIGDSYYAYGTETASSEALYAEPINSTTLNVYTDTAVLVTMQASNSYNFAAGVPNIIKTKKYYIKDAYIDIGENVTTAEVEEALADDLENPTARQLQIQKAIGVMEQDASVYVYGLRINNTNSSDTNLSGGVFQAYRDASCTQPIGQPITITSGTGSFVGVSGLEVVYLKQITAPNGYRLFSDIIDIHPFSDQDVAASGHVKETVTLGQDSYYELTVVNQPMLSLPFTGGAGTIIYTVVGLVIVAGAIVFIALYKKKNKKEQNKENSEKSIL